MGVENVLNPVVTSRPFISSRAVLMSDISCSISLSLVSRDALNPRSFFVSFSSTMAGFSGYYIIHGEGI